MKKLDSKGVSHLIAPLLVVVAVAIAGTVALVASHADSVNSNDPIASASSVRCKKGTTLVNAIPEDFFSGKSRSAARRGHGLICVHSTAGRQVVSGYTPDTITYYLKCPTNSTFAYDRNNPDGTGYHQKYRVRTTSGGDRRDLKTLYCIKKKDLYRDLTMKGHSVVTGKGAVDDWKSGSFHNYHFYPAFDLRSACVPYAHKYTGCKTNYYFSYYRNGDQINF